MRALLVVTIAALAVTGSSQADQNAAEGTSTIKGATAETTTNEPGDLQGCGICTLRHQSRIKKLKERKAAKEAHGNCQIKGDIGANEERSYE